MHKIIRHARSKADDLNREDERRSLGVHTSVMNSEQKSGNDVESFDRADRKSLRLWRSRTRIKSSARATSIYIWSRVNGRAIGGWQISGNDPEPHPAEPAVVSH